jgi:hypothetical protein
MSNTFNPSNKPPPAWTPSPRLTLWTELERLHEKLGMAPPTASLTIEQLEEEIARLKQEVGEE